MLWLLLTALLVEGGARLALRLLPERAPIRFGWEKGEGNAAPVRDLVYVPDPELFFRLAPNLSVATTANPRIFDLHTNAQGLRNGPIEPRGRAGTLRILAVGDSCTFGSGAGQDETWPAQLESRLADRLARPVEVLNAGVPGFTSYQALRYLGLEGFALEPDAVVFTSGINDASPATAGSKRRFGEGRLLSDREYAEALRGQRLGITRLLWRAGFGRGAGAASAPGDVKRRVPLAEYESRLREFALESRERGALAVIVAWPLRGQASEPPQRGQVEVVAERYQRAARLAAEAAGAVFVDLQPALAGREDLFVDAVHLGPEGYAVVAEWLAGALAPALPAGSGAGSP